MNFCDGFSGAVLIALVDGRVVYWNQTAASEFGWLQIESRNRAGQDLVSAPSDTPNFIHSGGPLGSEACAQPVKVILQSGKAAWLESRMTLLTDAEGGVCGHLHRLQRAKTSEPATDQLGPSEAVKPTVTKRQVLHQLNNIFACIHSSLDLALGAKEAAEGAAFVQQAQESTRKGAQLITELQLREMEAPGAASSDASEVRPHSTVLADTGDDPAPAALEGKERLLLAEDSQSMRALIRAVLTYRGYTIIEAADGEEAVNKFSSDGPFDLVLLDMGLPKLVGPEVLRRLRAQNPAVRVLALSGGLFGGEENAVESGGSFDGFLNKPFRNIEMVKLVRRILDRPAAA